MRYNERSKVKVCHKFVPSIEYVCMVLLDLTILCNLLVIIAISIRTTIDSTI